MIEQESTAHHARKPNPYPPQALLECIEAELSRLRERRPHLAKKIQRAEHTLTAHIAGHPRLPVIRVRVGAGSPRFLVRSLSASGAIYVVWPSAWSCSCPSYHRSIDRGSTCKHVVACFVLKRISKVDRSSGVMTRRGDSDECFLCDNGLVRIGQKHVNEVTGELVERTLTLPCRQCKGGSR